MKKIFRFSIIPGHLGRLLSIINIRDLKKDNKYNTLIIEKNGPKCPGVSESITRLQRKSARFFGESRGWYLSRPFSSTQLSRKKVLPVRLLEHAYFFRDSKTGNPAAICAFLSSGLSEADIRSNAEFCGLSAFFPSDFVSWHCPGTAKLVVYVSQEIYS